jgi:O-antigen/teichoic acid export membrane protein
MNIKNYISNVLLFLTNIRFKGFFHLLTANLLIQIFAFASQLFVAGILSPDDIGRIKIIQTYFSIFTIIAGMGFNASTLKICSENRTDKENARYFNSALLFSIVSSVVIYVIILSINYLNVFSKDIIIKMLIPIGLFPVVSNTLFMLFVTYFHAKKEIKLFSKLVVSNKLISILVIIILTYVYGIIGYYIAFNLSFIFMIVVSVITLKKFISFTFKLNIKELFIEHWKYARSSLFSNIISELSAYLDIILISIFVINMHEIGHYSFALTLIVILRLFPTSVQQITIPYFSSYKLDKFNFLVTFKKYNRILHLVVGFTLVVFLLFVPSFVHFIFNGKYDQSFQYLYFLSIGWSIRNLIQLQSAAIFGLGKIHYNAYTALCALIGNIIIYPVAIYYFGLMGAAYASISSGTIIWIASRYYFKKAIRKTTWEA